MNIEVTKTIHSSVNHVPQTAGTDMRAGILFVWWEFKYRISVYEMWKAILPCL